MEDFLIICTKCDFDKLMYRIIDFTASNDNSLSYNHAEVGLY